MCPQEHVVPRQAHHKHHNMARQGKRLGVSKACMARQSSSCSSPGSPPLPPPTLHQLPQNGALKVVCGAAAVDQHVVQQLRVPPRVVHHALHLVNQGGALRSTRLSGHHGCAPSERCQALSVCSNWCMLTAAVCTHCRGGTGRPAQLLQEPAPAGCMCTTRYAQLACTQLCL